MRLGSGELITLRGKMQITSEQVGRSYSTACGTIMIKIAIKINSKLHKKRQGATRIEPHFAAKDRYSELREGSRKSRAWAGAIAETLRTDQPQLLDSFGELVREIKSDGPAQ